MPKTKTIMPYIKRLLLASVIISISFLAFGFIVSIGVIKTFKIQGSESDIRRMAHSLIEFHPVYGINNRESPQSGDGEELLDIKDPWDNIVHFYWNENFFVLAYAGPDKKFGTPDDMAIEYEWWDIEQMGKYPQRFVGKFTGWHSGIGGGTHVFSYKGGSRVLRETPDYSWTNWNHITGHQRGR